MGRTRPRAGRGRSSGRRIKTNGKVRVSVRKRLSPKVMKPRQETRSAPWWPDGIPWPAALGRAGSGFHTLRVCGREIMFLLPDKKIESIAQPN